MLNQHAITHAGDTLMLRIAGGDPIRADHLRATAHRTVQSVITLTYIPLLLAVAALYLHRPAPVDVVTVAEQRTAVESFAVRYVSTYLKDPSDQTAIKAFYTGDVPPTAIPPGGRALRASSALPGSVVEGFQTWSAVVDAEIPKAANSAAMVPLTMQVYVSIDHDNLFRAIALPLARPERPSGTPVELATQTVISPATPVFNTVSGFLNALLIGQGDLAPYVAAGSTLRPASPPRFAAMQIERVTTSADLAAAQDVPPKADGVEVTVRAVLQTASGVLLPMDFPLRMSVAAGHWQVDAINDNPAIIPPSQTGDQISATTPATPTTGAPYGTDRAAGAAVN